MSDAANRGKTFLLPDYGTCQIGHITTHPIYRNTIAFFISQRYNINTADACINYTKTQNLKIQNPKIQKYKNTKTSRTAISQNNCLPGRGKRNDRYYTLDSRPFIICF
jgi:hypothetical protein